MRRNTFVHLAGTAVALLAFLLAAPPSAAGPCVVADVPGRIQLPDGTVYDAGTLKLCVARRLSPLTAIHTAYVSGRAAGMFVSRASTNEKGGDDPPQMVFQRNAVGDLMLVGYTSGPGHPTWSYRMASTPRDATARSEVTAHPAM